MTAQEQYIIVCSKYPNLSRGAKPLAPPPGEVLGRDIGELVRCLRNPEKANVALLAEPGSGKTAYVQAFAHAKEYEGQYLVLDVNPELLIEKDGDRDNALLVGFNALLDDAGQYAKDQNVIVVLFVDEFHKLAMISPSLMNSLKPRLEKSAMHGFRLIAATTFQEYNDNIAVDRALDQRFLQMKLTELPKEAVLAILKDRAKKHGAEHLLEEGVLSDIYTESKRILLSNAQPRASIDVFNSMIGDAVKREWMEGGILKKEYYTAEELHFSGDKVLCRALLTRIIKRSYGIDINNRVSVEDVTNALKRRLFNQEHAIELVVRQLEMAAQGFGELDRPKFSFISTGSTGCGKTELAKIVSDTMQLPLRRFDMSRYSSPEDANAFADDLFTAAWAYPNAYILIDEVEKSSKKAMNILLQVLDDARLADSVNSERVASFTGTIINLTTNLGSEVYREQARHQVENAEADAEVVYKSLADSEVFETAVLGRLDAIVPFHPLPESALMKIAKRTFDEALSGLDRDVYVTDDVYSYIVKDRTSSDTERGGARDVKRNVRNLALQKLAHYLTTSVNHNPVVILVKGQPRFKYKDVADPLNAKIKVQECYPTATVNALLKSASASLGMPLQNAGLYLPSNRELKSYVLEILSKAKDGWFKFKSVFDCETVRIEGVK